MDVEMDRRTFGAAVRAAQDTVTSIRATTQTADRRAMSIVEGWSGEASEDFLEAWLAWRAGAMAVAEGIESLGRLLAETGADLDATDRAVRSHLDLLRARLGGAGR